MNKNWFVITPYDGIHYYNTEEEALAAVEDELNEFSNSAFEEGWDEEVENLVVGQVSHRLEKFGVVKRQGELNEDGYDENNVYWPHADFDEMYGYRFARIKEQ